ncbi:MAG: CCA tRNA nucleotidyltransferase [Chlamydiota bacterium]
MDAYSVAEQIIQKLYQEGFTAYFAGGWVRDFLMDHPSDDIDIATNAHVTDIQRIFPKTIPIGVSFGIVIIVEKGHQFEVATFRKDRGYKDGRRPIGIEPATPEEDAQRRDFTINGMFYDSIQHRILDYVEGQKDLELGIIRAIGNPHERFLEDRLRMIRAVRYASRFHFSIEEETVKAILDHADALFPAVAIERIWNELVKMSDFSHLDSALISLHQLNLLPVIFPTLKDLTAEAVKQRVARLPYFPKEAPIIAKILELFPTTSLEEKENFCTYFKLSNRDRQFTAFYHTTLEILLHRYHHYDHYRWAQLYAHPHFTTCLKIAALHFSIEERQVFLQAHHSRFQSLSKVIKRLQSGPPFLQSEDLRAAGIANGKQMGVLLKEGEKIAINEQLTDPQEIIARLRKLPLWER